MTNAPPAQDPPGDEQKAEPPDPPGGEVASTIGQQIREFGDILRDTFLTFDRRTLGFARFMLGFFLLGDLGRRTGTWMDLYSSKGVLPTELDLRSPSMGGTFSIFHAFSSPPELAALWALMFVTFFCVFIGYKTKIAQILSLVFVTGMNVRLGQIANGGYTVENLVVLWTCFLPLGDRFSVDALLASMKRRREASADELNDRSDVLTSEQRSPHITLLALVLVIQIAAIYFFNVIHKTGPAWKNGTAVHYVLYVDRMVNPIVGLVRDHIPNWGIIFLTRSTLICEAVIPVAVLSPLARVWARRLAIAMINFIHLGFGVAMVLGPFAWACCVLSTLLFSPEDWDLAYRTMRRTHRARVVRYDPRSPGALLVCRLIKRLDQFELISFEEAEGLELGIAVERPDGEIAERAEAIADITAALPLGPTVAWILRVPPFKGVADAICAAIEARDVSRALGLRLGPSVTLPGPSRVRRRLGQAAIGLREILILAMFAAEVNQAMVQLWVITKLWKFSQPEPLLSLSRKMRFDQEWYMFSPNPVMDDGTIVVDAITVDGRHIDPFTRKPPDFEIGKVKSFGYNQIWSDYLNRMHMGGYMGYRDAMKAYMLRLPERTGNPNDAIVSGDVWWAQDMNPKWNETQSYQYQQIKVFSFDNPAAKKVVP